MVGAVVVEQGERWVNRWRPQEMDGECFEWETWLHFSWTTWVSALQRWPKRRSHDGGDEMRTGGGLSFNEEWSSPCRSAKLQPIEQ